MNETEIKILIGEMTITITQLANQVKALIAANETLLKELAKAKAEIAQLKAPPAGDEIPAGQLRVINADGKD